MRLPWPAVAGGALVVALGAAGLIRGAMPQSAAAGPGDSDQTSDPIVVTNAYVHPPLPPNDEAAAYFTVHNTTDRPDRLVRVDSGAGEAAEVHAVGPDGTMSATGAVVPARGTLTLSPGKGHVMIEHVYGTLKAGQNVNIALQFANAGSVDVDAKVVGYASSDIPTDRPSGAHS